MPALETRVHDSIDEIEPAMWDSLLEPGDYLASHRFVGVCERSGIGAAQFRHVLVFEGGALAGLASLFRMDVPLDLLTTGVTRRLFDLARRLKPSLTRVPVVFCGLPVSLGGSCLRIAPNRAASEVVACITAAMEDFAAETKTGFLCCKEFAQQEQNLFAAALGASGFFSVPSQPGCKLDIHWHDWPDYQGSLRAGYRRQLRLDRRAMEGVGLRFEHGSGLLPDIATVHRLYGQVMARATLKMEVLPEHFFRLLGQAASGRLHSIVGYLGDRPVANAILLWQPPACHFLLAGLDYAALRPGHVYQNLVTEVVRTAITLGAEHLELGQTSCDFKGRLGALPTPRFIWLKHGGRMRHGFLAHAAPWLFPQPETKPRKVFNADQS